MQTTTRTSSREHRRFSKAVRAACGQSGKSYPIVIVDGFAAPRLRGRSYYWTTLSGKTEIAYPKAYGWPTLYHASERRIEVGAGWLIENNLA